MTTIGETIQTVTSLPEYSIIILFFLVLLSFQVSLNFIYRLFKNKKVNEVKTSQYGNRKTVAEKT